MLLKWLLRISEEGRNIHIHPRFLYSLAAKVAMATVIHMWESWGRSVLFTPPPPTSFFVALHHQDTRVRKKSVRLWILIKETNNILWWEDFSSMMAVGEVLRARGHWCEILRDGCAIELFVIDWILKQYFTLSLIFLRHSKIIDLIFTKAWAS